jgi:hypothetical protein
MAVYGGCRVFAMKKISGVSIDRITASNVRHPGRERNRIASFFLSVEPENIEIRVNYK